MIMGKDRRSIVTKNLIYYIRPHGEIITKSRKALLAAAKLRYDTYLLYFADEEGDGVYPVTRQEFCSVVMLPEMVRANNKQMLKTELPAWINKKNAISATHQAEIGVVCIYFRQGQSVPLNLSEMPEFLKQKRRRKKKCE